MTLAVVLGDASPQAGKSALTEIALADRVFGRRDRDLLNLLQKNWAPSPRF